jgi:hypothetical protein
MTGFLNSEDNTKTAPYTSRHDSLNLKDANIFRNSAHKLLHKFSQFLCNPITSACVQSDYISVCAIRLHNVCNRVTQREQLYYTRCVIELPNVKKVIT